MTTWESSLPFAKPWQNAGKPDRGILAVLGPGLMTCLADSDVGGLLTMAVSGSRCGYVLLPLQLVLAPALYMAQELTVRLGTCSHRSLSGLAFDHLGQFWGAMSLLSCVGVGCLAIVSEFTGVAAVGELWGIPRATSCCLSAALLGFVVMRGDFRCVEKLGLLLASTTCVFILLGFVCRPSVHELLTVNSDVFQQPGIGKLVAANIGTVITPWMLFYQLSAGVEKRLTQANLALARADTAMGVVGTQIVMISMLVTFARLAKGTDLEHLPIHQALVAPLHPLLGKFGAKVIMSLGLLGSSMLATLVASLGVGWNCADTLGARGASQFTWRLVVLMSVICGAVIIGLNLANVVHLNVAIQVVNGLSMPLVVGILFFIARSDALPPSLRLSGNYGTICGVAFLVCSLGTMVSSFSDGF